MPRKREHIDTDSGEIKRPGRTRVQSSEIACGASICNSLAKTQMAEAMAAALGGGCREEGKKRTQVEPSEDAYVEAVRERRRARSLRSQEIRAMVAKVLSDADEFLYKLNNKSAGSILARDLSE
jgi:hypothetical protein